LPEHAEGTMHHVVGQSQSDKMRKMNLIFIMYATMLLFAGAAMGTDFGKERPIAVVVGSEQWQPAIGGHIVAWADNRSGNYDIFM
jgi:beta propeller repeat protein